MLYLFNRITARTIAGAFSTATVYNIKNSHPTFADDLPRLTSDEIKKMVDDAAAREPRMIFYPSHSRSPRSFWSFGWTKDGERLERIIEQKGITIDMIARALGVSRLEIANIEVEDTFYNERRIGQIKIKLKWFSGPHEKMHALSALMEKKGIHNLYIEGTDEWRGMQLSEPTHLTIYGYDDAIRFLDFIKDNQPDADLMVEKSCDEKRSGPRKK